MDSHADANPLFFREGSVIRDPLENEPRWKRTEGVPQHIRVLTKESAVRDGLEFLTYLLQDCEGHCGIYGGFYQMVGEWKQQISEIEDSAAPVRFLVGIVGATGVGKSSTINAILGFENLLPNDDHQASTSVATDISWNYSDAEGERFRAEIQLVSAEEWKAEVEILHSDLHGIKVKLECNMDNNEDLGENDQIQAAEERVTNALQRLQSVYPHLNKNRLLEMEVEEIIAEPGVRDTLQQPPIFLARPDQASFAKLIEPYITSMSTKIGHRQSCTLSCLVKSMNIYVKSNVLRHGLHLVDLPGTHDTNAARSNVAKSFFSKLDRTIVATRMVRAADDQVALKQLLGSANHRNLQFDGKMNSKHLCYIMTCIDHIDFEKYLAKHPELSEQLEEEIQTSRSLEAQLREVDEKLKSKSKEARGISQQINILNGGARPTKKQKVRAQEPATDIVVASRVERGEALLKGVKDTIEQYKLEKSKLETALSDSHSKITAKCIQDRGESQSQVVKKNFLSLTATRRARRPREPVEDLQVFGISAPSFHKLQKKTVFGFPDEESTGIPALREWCNDSTMEVREERADTILNQLEMFMARIMNFSYDGNIGNKLLPHERDYVDAEITLQMDRLEAEMARIRLNITTGIENHITKNVFAFLADAEAASKNSILKTVAGWAVGIYWSTYRAIAHRLGRMKGSMKGGIPTDYDWNEDIVASYMTPLTEGWEKVFHEELPHLKEELKSEVATIFEVFKADFIRQVTCLNPRLRDPLSRLEPSFLPLQESFYQAIKRAIEKVRIKSCKTHRLAPPIVLETMKPAYEFCSSQSGTGHFRKNKAHMRAHALANCDAMNRKTTDAMKGKLTKAIASIEPKLETASNRVVESFRETITHMLDENTAAGTRTTGRAHARLGTKELRDIVRNNCVHLYEAWKRELVVEAELEEEVNDEDEGYGIDDINF